MLDIPNFFPQRAIAQVPRARANVLQIMSEVLYVATKPNTDAQSQNVLKTYATELMQLDPNETD